MMKSTKHNFQLLDVVDRSLGHSEIIQYDIVTFILINYCSTPENDMMAFIDDDSLVDDRRHEECRGPCPSPTMSPSPPLLQNGWSSSLNSRVKQQPEIPKSEPQIPSSNVNNNNNNNNIGNVNNGKRNLNETFLWKL